MFYIQASSAGAVAQAAVDRNLMINLLPSLEPGLVRVTGPQDQTLYKLAQDLGALPTSGPRWLGDNAGAPAP